MGNVCDRINIGHNREKDTQITNIKISPFAKRFAYYYIFHQKIENVFNNNPNQINNDNIKDSKIKFESQKLYILDKDWIQYWKSHAEYNSIKEELDKDYFVNGQNEEKELRKICQVILNKKENEEFVQIFNNSMNTYNNFIHNNNLKLEDFDILLNEDTFKSFENINYANYFIKKNFIKGIILNRMIILFIKELYIIKFLYRGFLENNEALIQLTANCLVKNEKTDKFDLEASNSKYENFKKFIKDQTDESLIDIFNSQNIGFYQEITLPLDNYNVNIRNENLYSKYLNRITSLKKEINFANINKFKK